MLPFCLFCHPTHGYTPPLQKCRELLQRLAATALQGHLAEELELLRTNHHACTFHDGGLASEVTLGEGRTTACRSDDAFNLVVFSSEPIPTGPAYFEVLVPLRATPSATGRKTDCVCVTL